MENPTFGSSKACGLPRSSEHTNIRKGSIWSINSKFVTYIVVGVTISFLVAVSLALFPSAVAFLSPAHVSDSELVEILENDENGSSSNLTDSQYDLSPTSTPPKSESITSESVPSSNSTASNSDIVTVPQKNLFTDSKTDIGPESNSSGSEFVSQRNRERDTSFHFSPRTLGLDELRQRWWIANPDFRKGRPKVRVVTSSSPNPCPRSIDTHMLLRTAKNKLHYCRLHDIQMQYSLVEPDENEFNGGWAKLPLIRMLMLAHPEVEWFWWMDSNVVFTDMEFSLPLQKYVSQNFVIYGDDERVNRLKDWKGLNTGNFLIRNCQWSVDFLDAWGSMGSAKTRYEPGKVLSDSLVDRPQGTEADDQSALVYLLSTEKGLWGPKTHFEKDLHFTASWTNVTNKVEELEELGHGDSERQWPVATEFSGCSRCYGNKSGAWPWEHCELEMDRTMDFAENQMYRRYGYQYQALGVHESRLDPIPGYKMDSVVASDSMPADNTTQREYFGYPFHKLPGPQVKEWDAQRRAWFETHANVSRLNEYGSPKMMIVTGSSTRECPQPLGEHYLLQSLKNKLDYARLHDMQVYYGMADFDREMDYWWTKIPTIRVLMLSHPDLEWFWWCDGDAVITDINFEIPFDKFEGKNLVLYGSDDLVYNQRDWIGINAGVYFARNCQWTLDLFDAWAAFGPKDVRVESGRNLTNYFAGTNRPKNFAADDQSALVYMLIMDKEKVWSPHVRLERSFYMSGYWKDLAPRFENMKNSSALSGSTDYPLITHFAGCQPCGSKSGNFDVAECHLQMQRTWDFADDQVLAIYGWEHSSLGKPQVHRLRP